MLPDDGNRYEIIDGALYMTTAPSSFHQWIVRRLERYVGIPAEDQDLSYAFPAPIVVIMPGADPVQPDYVVVLRSNAHILREGRIKGVPNVLVEILSPSNAAYDEHVKLPAYALAGVPEYAIIDPRKRTLSHYRLEAAGRDAAPRVFGEADSMSFDCLPQIAIPVDKLFAGAPDPTL
jgi:Uma2 family endonuclease